MTILDPMMSALNEILHFDDCSSLSEINFRLNEISKILLTETEVFNVQTNSTFRITGVELFLHHKGLGIKDPFAHKDELQSKKAKWNIHKNFPSDEFKVRKRTDLEITCGNKDYSAAIKIDGLEVMPIGYPIFYNATTTPDKNIFSGMSRSLNQIINTGSKKVNEGKWSRDEQERMQMFDGRNVFDNNVLILRKAKRPLTNNTIYLGKRASIQSLKGEKNDLSKDSPSVKELNRALSRSFKFSRKSIFSNTIFNLAQFGSQVEVYQEFKFKKVG
jgi:hypothetical protein